MGVVFAKTDKGRNEITDRAGGLHPRMRRILIMVDGKRTVDELRDFAAADDLTHSLGELEEKGYIEAVKVRDKQGGETPVEGDLPSITAFRDLGATPDPAELEKARHFMINTLRTFCGQYTYMTLMSAINSAAGHAELRGLYPDWYRHVIESRQGRRRAEELRARLLEVI
ncbi:MAG: hypothetical protein KDH15_09650 [Rhodocyclaceae bacterium]|nr:hypothetical protein [Rhodocyclaceae bacterium]